MSLRLVGCSHHSSSVQVREQLAFTPDQIPLALERLRSQFPGLETVLLSTCNRVELYVADVKEELPSFEQLAAFMSDFHQVDPQLVRNELFYHDDQEAVRHLFLVAASLDSMVLGEAQILSQVKQAFTAAQELGFTGPITHHAFEAAFRVAKRVAHDTEINRRRVSIPSIAVADYAKQLFETLHDKKVLLLGAGEMGEETLRYLRAKALDRSSCSIAAASAPCACPRPWRPPSMIGSNSITASAGPT